MIAWPGTLPQLPLEESFDETLPYQGDRSSVAELPLVQRQTTQAAVRPLTLTIQVTNDQLDIFQNFYRETLGFGALRFTWVHPRTQAATTLRFIAKQVPEMTPKGYDTYHVKLPLQVMP